jgi:hypothetical protein
MSELKVFRELAPLLVEAIPQVVACRRPPRSLCRLRVYYYDTHAPCTYLVLQPATADWRAELLARHGKKAPLHYWASWADGGDLPGIDLDGPGRLAELFEDVYTLLCEDEAKHMVAFRDMLQRMCGELNNRDWHSFCPVTDDFVVVPADGSAYFTDDQPDIVRSIPTARLELLRSRGLGLPEE